MTKPRVHIDVGHGWVKANSGEVFDRGAVSYSKAITEYALNSKQAPLLSSALIAAGFDVQVYDAFSLSQAKRIEERAAGAIGATYWLSLHHNASLIGRTQGCEVIIAGETWSTRDESAHVGAHITREIAKELAITDRGVKPRRDLGVFRGIVSRAPRAVSLRAALLIESFFMDVKADEEKLFEWNRRAAHAIARALITHASVAGMLTTGKSASQQGPETPAG